MAGTESPVERVARVAVSEAERLSDLAARAEHAVLDAQTGSATAAYGFQAMDELRQTLEDHARILAWLTSALSGNDASLESLQASIRLSRVRAELGGADPNVPPVVSNGPGQNDDITFF